MVPAVSARQSSTETVRVTDNWRARGSGHLAEAPLRSAHRLTFIASPEKAAQH